MEQEHITGKESEDVSDSIPPNIEPEHGEGDWIDIVNVMGARHAATRHHAGVGCKSSGALGISLARSMASLYPSLDGLSFNIMARIRLWILLLLLVQAVGVALLVAGFAWLGLPMLAGSHAVILWGTLTPGSQWFGPVVVRADPEWMPAVRLSGDRVLQITIDDGPDPRTTPALLDSLDRMGIKVTFFLIGAKAGQWPELVHEIANRGHRIGNHTQTHPAGRFWCIGPAGARQEMVACDQVVESVTGEQPLLFRSPVGHSNPFVRLVAARLGKQIVAWSVRGFDGVGRSREVVVKRIVAGIQPGALIVIHEGYDPADRGYSPSDILQDVVLAMREIA